MVQDQHIVFLRFHQVRDAQRWPSQAAIQLQAHCWSNLLRSIFTTIDIHHPRPSEIARLRLQRPVLVRSRIAEIPEYIVDLLWRKNGLHHLALSLPSVDHTPLSSIPHC